MLPLPRLDHGQSWLQQQQQHSQHSQGTAAMPFTGQVTSTIQALRLVHAARQGVIPRITRRFNDSERRTLIKSGACFVFDVAESGIKRWTDGLLWSQSRIDGNFLVYREINERSNPARIPQHLQHEGPLSTSGLAFPDPSRSPPSPDTHSPRRAGSTQPTFKRDGLIKKTITVNIEDADLHLICYFTEEDVRSGMLKTCASRPDIMALPLSPDIFNLTVFRNPPRVEIGQDGRRSFVDDEARDRHAYDSQGSESSRGRAESYSSYSGLESTSPERSGVTLHSPTSVHERPYYGGGDESHRTSHISPAQRSWSHAIARPEDNDYDSAAGYSGQDRTHSDVKPFQSNYASTSTTAHSTYLRPIASTSDVRSRAMTPSLPQIQAQRPYSQQAHVPSGHLPRVTDSYGYPRSNEDRSYSNRTPMPTMRPYGSTAQGQDHRWVPPSTASAPTSWNYSGSGFPDAYGQQQPRIKEELHHDVNLGDHSTTTPTSEDSGTSYVTSGYDYSAHSQSSRGEGYDPSGSTRTQSF